MPGVLSVKAEIPHARGQVRVQIGAAANSGAEQEGSEAVAGRGAVCGCDRARGHAPPKGEVTALAVDVVDQRGFAHESELDAVGALFLGGVDLQVVFVANEVPDLRVAKVLVSTETKVGEKRGLEFRSREADACRGQPTERRRNLRFVPAA